MFLSKGGVSLESMNSKGKNQIIIVIYFLLAVSLFNIISYILYISNVGYSMFMTQIVKTIIYAVLCYFLYKKYDWARLALGIVLIATAVSGFFRTLEAALVGIPVSFWIIFITLLSLAYGAFGIQLLAAKNIKFYTQHNSHNSAT